VTRQHKFYRIDPPPADVYEKQNFNAFSNEKLAERLSAHSIKTLVIVGMDTQYCVETAIRNGYDLGYKIVVPVDLVATNAKHINMHNQTLELVRKTYGVLSDAEELTEMWGS
jgi:nicotinamidase-related amidase